MRIVDWCRLLALAAIWGSSFIFMRVLVPTIGPMWTATLRPLVAGCALFSVFLFLRADFAWRRFGRHYLVLAIVNLAAPFVLFSWAARSLPASTMVVLNSTSPLFGAIFAFAFFRDRLTAAKLLGFASAIVGVVLVKWGTVTTGAHDRPLLAVAAALLACACYGLGGNYMKKFARGADPAIVAAVTLLGAGLVLLPFASQAPAVGTIDARVVACVLALALVCSALAYLLYYRLIADVGPVKALTVTFLMPAFGVVWGAVFLGETISAVMLAGCLAILLGTLLVTGVLSLRLPGVARLAERSRS